jgi:PPK2 family polyphosphate:nucleotide phosphotransferase
MGNESQDDPCLVPPGKKVSLAKEYDPAFISKEVTKDEADRLLQESVQRLAEYQDKLWAQNTRALLIVLQAMDAAGKDGVIKHVMSGLNPQGCRVTSFKAPSLEELDHDFLWRCSKALPERGQIGIFNRSYYEEVLVVRVHPEFLAAQHLPGSSVDPGIWERRFDEINCFERHLTDSGTVLLKLFLNISKKEQKKRFLERIDTPEKNWKFSVADAKERGFWDEYMSGYQEMLRRTSTEWAPWYVVPADRKWYARLTVAQLIADKMKQIAPEYPVVGAEQKQQLLAARDLLTREE